jgi:hypothetical protein
MPEVVDEIGKRYGKLVVVSRAESKHSKVMWNCLCDCGSTTTSYGSALRQGRVLSCGCSHTSHKMAKHPAYRAYSSAKDRCRTDANEKNLRNYHARGIQFKFASFEQFWEELGPTWKEGLTIDRKDNDGHYEPGNCRWATYGEQSDNRRITLKVNVSGYPMSLSQLAKHMGISYMSAFHKYKKFGDNLSNWM